MSPAALLLLAVAFAFPNEQGTRLLVTGEIAKPEILPHGTLRRWASRLRLIRTQTAGRSKTTSRQAPQNFAQTAGAVFQIIGGTISPGATCVLAEESFVAGATVVPLTRPPSDSRCSKATYPQIQMDKSRPVVGAGLLPHRPREFRSRVIEFSRHLTQALASRSSSMETVAYTSTTRRRSKALGTICGGWTTAAIFTRRASAWSSCSSVAQLT